MRGVGLLTGILVVACSRTPEPAPEPTSPQGAALGSPSAAAEKPTSASGADTSGAPAASVPSPSDSNGCVEDGVAQRQMQAVSPQQIEADCRQQCARK